MTAPGWPNPDEAKKVMRSAYIASGANEKEFNAALLGVLSTMVGPAQWAEAAALAVNCFRDRAK